MPLVLKVGESKILVVGHRKDTQQPISISGQKIPLDSGLRCSICRSIDYPHFTKEESIAGCGNYGLDNPKFSCFIAYECTLPSNLL